METSETEVENTRTGKHSAGENEYCMHAYIIKDCLQIYVVPIKIPMTLLLQKASIQKASIEAKKVPHSQRDFEEKEQIWRY